MKGLTFPLPLDPGRDLRSQLLERVLGRCIEGLGAADVRRRQTLESGAWQRHAAMVRAHVRGAFGPMPFGKDGGPLNARLVSRHDARACRIENVLFDSFPGWEVNASLFVPQGKGPFPAVVIPVGHSGKQFENYQIPAQAFASLGFLAVLFDPPGQASERQIGNDHFREGVRGYLTGLSANRYFVLDALRCIDYLETRPDADLSHGVGMTGVSGGGFTTACATLYDERIACQGPSCCITRLADHPVGDGYSACPETLWWNRVGDGVDEVDIVLGAIPVPTVYMAGVRDEVFHIEWSRELAAVIAGGFAAAGAPERFAFHEDPAGHAYTLGQVEVFAAWMDRWLLGLREAKCGVKRLDRADFDMLDYEMLTCRPSQAVTMFSLNRDAARAQRARRPGAPTLEAARAAVRRLTAPSAPFAAGGAPATWQETDAVLLWAQEYREALCVWDGLAMPVSLFTPAAPVVRARWVLYLDDGGRRRALESGSPAAQVAGLFETGPGARLPALAVADLPGWGESEPALMPFAVTGWGSRDRMISYLAVALGDGILGMHVRAAAALIEAFGVRAGGEGLALVGRGLGGAVALLAAALSDRVSSVVAWSSLAAFELLATSEEYTWPAAAFLPNALREIDLPEVAAALAAAGRQVLVLDPLDAARRPLGPAEVAAMYAAGAAAGATVLAACPLRDALERIRRLW